MVSPGASPAEAEDEIGDVLFSTVALARKLGVDAETALRRTIRGFSARYERAMRLAEERGLDVASMGDDDLRRLFRETTDRADALNPE